MALKSWIPNQVHSKCTKLEWEWVKTLELMESEEQCQTVLSSGDPNSDAVTSGNHQ